MRLAAASASILTIIALNPFTRVSKALFPSRAISKKKSDSVLRADSHASEVSSAALTLAVPNTSAFLVAVTIIGDSLATSVAALLHDAAFLIKAVEDFSVAVANDAVRSVAVTIIGDSAVIDLPAELIAFTSASYAFCKLTS